MRPLSLAGMFAIQDKQKEYRDNGSDSLRIKMVSTSAETLASDAFQEQQAERFCDWFVHNVPHGIACKIRKKLFSIEKSFLS